MGNLTGNRNTLLLSGGTYSREQMIRTEKGFRFPVILSNHKEQVNI